MSLFENDGYRWRETYFVLFDKSKRPSAKAVQACLKELGGRYEITKVGTDENGQFETVTLLSPHDFAAMDITYIEGDEVTEQVRELGEEMKNMTLTSEEMGKMGRMLECDARFDVYHFEQLGEGEDDEFLDPAALLIVLEQLADLCDGISIDPQSGSIV